MSAETTSLFSETQLPQIAKAIGGSIKDGIVRKSYHGLNLTIVRNDDEGQTILRLSHETEEGTGVIGEMPLDNSGVNISPRGVIFARPTLRNGLVLFSKLTRGEMPIVNGLQVPKGGIRKANYFASANLNKCLGLKGA